MRIEIFIPAVRWFGVPAVRSAGLSWCLKFALLLAAAVQFARAQVYTPGFTRNIPGVNRGEILMGELNCSACHQASEKAAARLLTRAAPLLGQSGVPIRPQFIRGFLEDPAAEKPGTLMPDMLHALPAAEKREAVEALTHYLMSEQEPEGSGTGADLFKIEQGRVLFHETGCVACHLPQQGPKAGSTPEIVPHALSTNSSLFPVHLASKYTVGALAKFLANPLAYRPAGRMPSLRLTEAEAMAVAMYLLRDQAGGASGGAAKPSQKIEGVTYEYFEGDFGQGADFEKLKPVGTGAVDRFSIAPRKRNENIAFRFQGYIKIPTNGTYNFFTFSDDGSRLYIDSKLVVDNDGNHAAQERRRSIELVAGDHPIMVTWYQGGAEYVLRVSYSGPGITKREIPARALWRLGAAMNPLGDSGFKLDQAKAARGKELYESMGCAACHTPSTQPRGPALASLTPAARGCLASEPPAKAARYALSGEQRAALTQTLSKVKELESPLLSRENAARRMAALNCYACHSRDQVGGPDPARSDYFKVNGSADLGDEGRIPPHLSGVGKKLRTDWLEEVLLKGGSVRPYMAARMPQFGSANVTPFLLGFAEADGAAAEVPEQHDATLAKYGRKLAGTDGLACISCHTFGKHKSLGIPAIDLTQMHHRLRKAWFQAYLIDPQSLRPGTRMPSFFPQGIAANREILNGNTDRQIEALWMYLAEGSKAELPAGLVQGRMELVATNEPVIYRNFIQGAGPRAIAVGYPEKANIAFDANETRLALIWEGPFIDAARHRTGRGEGFEPPLGNHVRKLPVGPPLALLTDPTTPWPSTAGKVAGFRMGGYELDSARRPMFLYRFHNVEVRDSIQPIRGELEPSIRREIHFNAADAPENLWFRAAMGATIQPEANGVYNVDGALHIKLQSGSGRPPLVRAGAGGQELIIPVTFQGGEATIIEEFSW